MSRVLPDKYKGRYTRMSRTTTGFIRSGDVS